MKKLKLTILAAMAGLHLIAQDLKHEQTYFKSVTSLHLYAGPTGYSGGLGSALIASKSAESMNLGIGIDRTFGKRIELFAGFENSVYQFYKEGGRQFSTGTFSGQLVARVNLLKVPFSSFRKNKLDVGAGFSVIGFYKNALYQNYTFTGALKVSLGYTHNFTKFFGLRIQSALTRPFSSEIDRFPSGKKDILFQQNIGVVIRLDKN